ncbi:MAG: AAA family ATPase [Porcipelethomonas sp.]
MIDYEKLKPILEEYKENFLSRWNEEKYKWVAVKHFQEQWKRTDIGFFEKFQNATEKHQNLLSTGQYWQPRSMIGYFCNICSEQKVKEQFDRLYDETTDLKERVTEFIEFFKSDDMIGKVIENRGKKLSTNQDARAISVYLESMFPDKYYFYFPGLYNEIKSISEFNQPKGFSSIDSMLKYMEMCDEICEYVKQDNDLINILENVITDNEHNDKSLHILTQDIVYFFYQKNNKSNVTYLSEIIESLKELGGIASLNDLNNKIQERGLLKSINTNSNWKYAVSMNLQQHCKETKSYVEGNENLFYSVEGLGKGVWGLRGYEQDEVETDINPYTKYDFLNDVYISENEYNKLITLLKHKKNIILQGAPGVGKTFAAKRLAYAMMGEIDESRIEFIQFHQNYSYEDFIMGYRPDGEGFKLTEGIFYRFCQKAANNPDKEHFFIIDEINRGNMSKIFGELMMLIEKDYRATKATLAYSGMPFSVPENLYIIGMMNTADRSLAMIDYALRRRFSFFEMEPGFDSEGFSKYRKSLENETFDALIEMIKILNKDISDDKSLGRGFRIGHSYFCGCDKDDCTTDWMRSVVEFDILPMLEEYWFDEPSKLQQWKNNLRGVFDD